MTDEPEIPIFDAGESSTEPRPPRPFTLSGVDAKGKPWTETFAVMGELPQGVLDDLSQAISIKDGQIRYSTRAVVGFLRGALVIDDEDRFELLLRDKRRLVRLEQLGDVMLWAVAQVTDRPTSPSPISSDGRRDTDDGSEGEISEPGEIPDGGMLSI